MSSPKIDIRDKQAIQKQIQTLASTYLPQWQAKGKDAGWAIAQSFAKMNEDLIKRVNQVPDKLIVDYLNRLNFTLHPPLSAKVPVVFTLVEGTKESKIIPQNTQLSDSKQVVFESEKTFSATPTKLSAIYSVQDKKVYNHSVFIENKKPFTFFTGKNMATKTTIDLNHVFLFNNYLPIDTKTDFYPFGTTPQKEDCFYIGSKVFSKDGVTIDISGVSELGNKIVWEYWDGKRWTIFQSNQDLNCKPIMNGTKVTSTPFIATHFCYIDVNLFSFACQKITETEINGIKSYWIRARLTTEELGTYVTNITYDNNNPKKITYKTTSGFKPPKITDFSISYTDNKISEEFSEKQAFYLGFDQPFGEGLISLLFVLSQKMWNQQQYLIWQYYSVEGWKPLNVIDATHGLTQTGTCEFLAPQNQKKKKMTYKNLFWLKIKIKETIETPKLDTIKLEGIYPNSIWVTHSETIKEEYIGSSDGTHRQKFKLLRAPVREVQLLVKEFLKPEDEDILYTPDEEEGFWVLWHECAYLYDALPSQRIFTLDPVSGEILFGNGHYGMIPPIGKDNIKVSYETGGGKKGNIAKRKIKDLVSSISGVESVINPVASSGGSDQESIENLIKRAPKTLRARDRAITFEDYEVLAKEASTDIAKVKAIPNFNIHDKNYKTTNAVSVLLIPFSHTSQPLCSEGLLRNVKSYLQERSAVTAKLYVDSPVFATVDLDLEIVFKSWDLIPQTKEKVEKRLALFLHPLYGGYEGEGWEFGVKPCESDFFSILAKIEGIDHIKKVNMHIKIDKNETILELKSYMIVCSGDFTIEPFSEKKGA